MKTIFFAKILGIFWQFYKLNRFKTIDKIHNLRLLKFLRSQSILKTMQNLVEVFWLFLSPPNRQQKALNMPNKAKSNKIGLSPNGLPKATPQRRA